MLAFHTPQLSNFYFGVSDMTSPLSTHQVSSALRNEDHAAKVRIDLSMRRVEIQSIRTQPHGFGDAIRQAGYTPIRQWPSDLIRA